MPLRPLLSTIVPMLIITACSDTSPPAAVNKADLASTVDAAVAVAPATTETVAVQLGVVFVDSDPTLMAGAVVVHGTLSVDDRLDMLGSSGQRVGVRIDAIKDDASTALVSTVKAPAGVFLTFTADTPSMTASDNLLVAQGSFADFESAKTFTAGMATDTASGINTTALPTAAATR